MKTYQASGGKHVSSNGNVNYMSCNDNDKIKTARRVFDEMGLGVVIVDGDDDWYGKVINKPARIAREASIELLAWFHTGISGLSISGVIIDASKFDAFVAKREEMSKEIENIDGIGQMDGLTIYRSPRKDTITQEHI